MSWPASFGFCEDMREQRLKLVRRIKARNVLQEDGKPLLRIRAARPAGLAGRRVSSGAAFVAIAIAAIGLSSCTVSSVLTPSVDVGTQTASVAAKPRGLARLASPAQMMSVGYPRLSRPLAEQTMQLPAAQNECRRQLRRLGVTYRDLAPINDGGACRIDWPVQVTALPGRIEMKPAATLSCEMALAFAQWTRSELTPSARWRYLSGVKTIHQGSSYSCRNIRRSGGVASEHSKGNALDVMRIELRNGKDIDVRKPGWFAFREKGLLNNVRAGGCQYFSTVLGPGYDADHADHFHFDIKNRRNGYVACR